MIEASPLAPDILLGIGPVPLGRAVVTTWGLMAFLALGCWLVTRRLRPDPNPAQAALEILVETVASQIEAVTRRDPWPWLPLIGTLFIYLVCANLAAVLPGVTAPTSHIETPAALALIVFLAAHVAGIRGRGLKAYLKGYLQPNPLLLPLNLLAEVTRTFSLMVRLSGNMMSHELVVAIVLLLAGLLVPIPFLLLAIMIGLIQAYIFTVLATVFIAAAAGDNGSA